MSQPLTRIYWPYRPRPGDPDAALVVQRNLEYLSRFGGVPGPAGPPGPTGPEGPAGPAGPGADTFIHTQATLAASWPITHNLNRFPSVTVVDSGESEVWPDVHYDSNNTMTLNFGAPTSGKAYLN